MSRPTAILGAGMAGLAAAHELQRHGRPVTVFDKARRPGGRVCTRRQADWQWDHGAQFFTVRDPEFAAALAPLRQSGQIQRWHGPFATLKDGIYGADPRPGAERWVGAPGMSALAAGLAADLPIHCEQRIQNLRCTEEGWWLQSALADGSTSAHGPFADLVLALPPLQAWELLQAAAPANPWCQMLQRSRSTLQPCLAAMVVFASTLDLPAAGLFVDDEALSFVAHDGSKPGRDDRPSYVLHATAGWSLAHQELAPEQFASELLSALARVLRRQLPSAQVLLGHRWRYALVSAELPKSDAVKPAAGPEVGPEVGQPGLALAGDWLVGGRVEGAYRSGLNAARRLLAHTASA